MGVRGAVGDRAGLGLPGSGRRADRAGLRHDGQQRDPAHRQADHAERQLLRRRRRHRHADPLHAGARHAERVRPQRADRLLRRDLHALRLLHRPGRLQLPSPCGEPELRDVRLRPDHHRQPRAPLRHERDVPRQGRPDDHDRVLLHRPGHAGPAPHLHADQRPRARHALEPAGLRGRLHADRRLHGRGLVHAPRLRRRAGRHLLAEAPRRQHAAVLDPAGDPGPLRQEP